MEVPLNGGLEHDVPFQMVIFSLIEKVTVHRILENSIPDSERNIPKKGTPKYKHKKISFRWLRVWGMSPRGLFGFS